MNEHNVLILHIESLLGASFVALLQTSDIPFHVHLVHVVAFGCRWCHVPFSTPTSMASRCPSHPSVRRSSLISGKKKGMTSFECEWMTSLSFLMDGGNQRNASGIGFRGRVFETQVHMFIV